MRYTSYYDADTLYNEIRDRVRNMYAVYVGTAADHVTKLEKYSYFCHGSALIILKAFMNHFASMPL
jgi:hypothetical protein